MPIIRVQFAMAKGKRALTAAALMTCLCASGIACAASDTSSPTQGATPPPTAANASPAAEAQRQQVQPFNNAPVWREVRSGAPQFTSLPGRETNVLIQPEGQTWRSLRNSQLSVYGGWALVALFLVIAAFYFYRGPIELHEPPTGRVIRRFTGFDRAIHWTTAISFSILAISGLIMLFGKMVLLPVIGYTLFSWLAILGKNLHNFVGPLFVVCTVLIFLNFVRDNFPAKGDWLWIRNFGGMLSKVETPSGRFNAGEKLWFWGGVTMLGVVVGTSGLVLDFPNFNQTRQTMQVAHVVHLIGATLFMLGAMGHIYMGTLGMAGAYEAMRYGYVDEEWAREHHAYWYNGIKAGKSPTAPTAPTPPTAAPSRMPQRTA